MSQYTLYSGVATRAHLTEMILIEADIPYEQKNIDIFNQEHQQEEFLEINPAGFVPVLVAPDGEVIYEMPAIHLYLAEKHQLDYLVPQQNEPERNGFLSGFFYICGELEPALKRYFYPHRYVKKEQDILWMWEKSLQDAIDRLTVIDKLIDQTGPYFLGDRYSLIDITLAFWCSYLDVDIAERLSQLEKLHRCITSVQARPKLKDKIPEQRQMFSDYRMTLSKKFGLPPV